MKKKKRKVSGFIGKRNIKYTWSNRINDISMLGRREVDIAL